MTNTVAPRKDSLATNLPAHEVVYRRIRDKILFGDLAPGQAVTIQGLVDEIGVSMTPIREAIRRLTAEGALVFQGNRRVCVPQMDSHSFAELVFARQSIEPELARLACENRDASLSQRLRAIDQQVNAAIDAGDVPGYMRSNHLFHFTLYGQAKSAVLLPITESLWLQFGPLYRIICGKWGTANVVDFHEEAVAALQAGDSKAVERAILQDIQQGFEIIHQEFTAGK